MADVGGYLGSYDFEKRKLEGCTKFKKSTDRFHQNRSGGLSLSNGHFPPQKINSPAAFVQQHADPLMAQLQIFKEKIAELEHSAWTYESEHINQTFRKINAECSMTQAKLDRLCLQGRPDAQQMRKELIVRTEKAAETLGSKLHPIMMGSSPCTICLKLA